MRIKLGSNFGEEVTNIARDKAYENNDPSSGILYLMQICEGMDIDQARSIIEGKNKLITSNNDLDMIDDNWIPPDFKAMKEEIMKYIYGNYEKDLYASKGGYAVQDIYGYKRQRYDVDFDAENLSTRNELLELMNISIPKAYSKYLTIKNAMKSLLENQGKEPFLTAMDRKILLYNSIYNNNQNLSPEIKNHKIKEIFKNNIRATNYGEECTETSCRYCTGVCTLDVRKTYGCFLDPQVEERINELELTKQFSSKAYVNRLGKTYDFIFKDIHFSAKDSARDQSCCAHCDNQITNRCIDPVSDCFIKGNSENKKFQFLGFKDFGNGDYAACFTCLKCGNMFYYHTQVTGIDPDLIEKYPDLIENN